MFGRKQRLIDQLSTLLAEITAENRRVRRELVELDERNARLRNQVHLYRLGFVADETRDPIATAERFEADVRFGFVVEVTR